MRLRNPSGDKNTSAPIFFKARVTEWLNQILNRIGCLAGGPMITGVTFFAKINEGSNFLSNKK